MLFRSGLLGMEMVSAKAIMYNSKNTEALMEIHPDEMPVSLQLFGSDADIISEMAKRIEDRPFSILDINMGCPVPKVVNNGEGSALMKNPALVREIVSKTVETVRKPVTVKIRKGFDGEHANAVEIAKAAEADTLISSIGFAACSADTTYFMSLRFITNALYAWADIYAR